MRKIANIISLFIALFSILSNAIYAQDDKRNNNNLSDQVIIIYTDYTPLLKDANRIQTLPIINDTVRIKPKFDYKILPKLYPTSFTPSTINAANVKKETLKPLDIGMIKIGVGNYLTPHLEAYINSRRQKDYSLGVKVLHHSSSGKIKNILGNKIYSGFMDNNISCYGKKILQNSSITGDIDFKHNQINYYGYNPVLIGNIRSTDLLPGDMIFNFPREKSEMETQNYIRFKTKAGIKSINLAKKRTDYELNLFYQYFQATNSIKQNKINVEAKLAQIINKHNISLNAVLENNSNQMSSFKQNQLLIKLNPYYKLNSHNWQIKLGAIASFEIKNKQTKYRFYPDVLIQHNISNTIIPYFSFKGYTEVNDFEHISTINPYIINNAYIVDYSGNVQNTAQDTLYNTFKNTAHSQIIDLGIKGNINKNISFVINANYSKINNMYFFVNDFRYFLANKFTIQYTNIERFCASTELNIKEISNLNINLKAKYYYYSYIQNREKPWHLPTLDISMNADYLLLDKITIGMNVNFMNKRYAKNNSTLTAIANQEFFTLKPIIDISLYGDYKIAYNFHAFVNLNNILAQKYYLWNDYMSQGFNVLVGVKYIF